MGLLVRRANRGVRLLTQELAVKISQVPYIGFILIGGLAVIAIIIVNLWDFFFPSNDDYSDPGSGVM